MNDDKTSSLLSGLAKRVKNIDGKILGKDGKPLMPYHSIKNKVVSNSVDGDAAGVMGHKKDYVEVGCSTSDSKGVDSNHIAAGNARTTCEGSKVMGDVDLALADVVLPLDEVDLISARLENSLYGYFVGQRPAFPVVQNFVRNVWRKHGIMHVMLHQGFFIFQFSTNDGMDNVLNQIHWRIRSVPLILNIWNPSSDLKKEEVNNVTVWVKTFKVTIVSY